MKTKNHFANRRAFTLIEIMIVVTVLCLLAVIAVTNFMLARDTSRLNVVRRNIRETDTTKEQWTSGKKQLEGTPVADVAESGEHLRGEEIQDLMQEPYAPNPAGMPPTTTLPAGTKLRELGPDATIPAR